MLQRHECKGICYYTSQLLSEAGFRHMFCTRMGGVSSGDFASLNVSTARKDRSGFPDSARNVEENYRRIADVLELAPEKACAAKQVHSDIVYTVQRTDGGKGVLEAFPVLDGCDGVLLEPDCEEIDAVCVKTADCVPILLANSETGAVCAVHAGWRGSAADIVTKAAKMLAHGCMEHILAAIGPCIGRCHYEVGEEVYAAFARLLRSKDAVSDIDRYVPVFPSCSMGGKRHADLAGINRALLEYSGVPSGNIEVSGFCTCCKTDEKTGEKLFFSHRASGGFSGTFASVICARK